MTGADDGRPILLLGATGQIGSELAHALTPLGPIITPGRDQLDLAQPEAISAVVDRVSPALLINAAAYTKVDQAEQERSEAMALNADAPGLLAQLAGRLAIPLVHYSTDYVFGGQEERNPDGELRAYVETDPVGPLNVYGHSKRMGEDAIRGSGCAHLIFRTSWIYANRGRNFLLTMRRLASERDEIAVVADQFGCPTWARSVAEATVMILSKAWRPDGTLSSDAVSGTYHLTCQGAASWFDFAKEIFSILSQSGYRAPRLKPITTNDYPTPAARPAYSVLDCSKARDVFGISLPDWREALASCLGDEIRAHQD
ncbi:MAG: dTDP-4-dehydrorhamnose reductase [Hyphomicrobiales bacterium]|nr:dTDP-4-dehydrorhamnose reductase [Hyphomicrobiales bacterium]